MTLRHLPRQFSVVRLGFTHRVTARQAPLLDASCLARYARYPLWMNRALLLSAC